VRLPVIVSATIELTGTMLAGQGVEALAVSLQHAGLLTLGLNCSTGPEVHDRPSAQPRVAHRVPHVGVAERRPAGRGRPLPRDADTDGRRAGALQSTGLAEPHRRLLRHDVRAHARLRADGAGQAPARAGTQHAHAVSGIDFVEAAEDNRPLLVGERTNEVGSGSSAA